MLKGIKIKSLNRHFDERGSFAEVMRKDWKEILEEDEFIQSNLSISYPGIIRAWHRHSRGQQDYYLVLDGALKLCIYDDENGSPTKGHLTEIVTTSELLEIVRIPGYYWHGFKCIGNQTSKILHFKNKLYDYEDPDEERRPWNDSTIIPKSINGNQDDPRVGIPWDWNLLPHR